MKFSLSKIPAEVTAITVIYTTSAENEVSRSKAR
jgi:hypothetical protein